MATRRKRLSGRTSLGGAAAAPFITSARSSEGKERSRRKSGRWKSMNRLTMSPVAKENAPPPMSTANLSAMYSQVIKLSTENKINVKNSWALPLIDHMDHLLQPEDQEELNFQRASCTLDASVKIYSYRVDDTWTSSYRVLESLNRTNQPGGAAEGDSDSEESGSAKRKTTARGKRATGGSTLENNRANLTMKQFDLEFDVDPLFHKMSKTFDEGGARGMLLVNLPVRPGCELVFDSCDAPLQNDHPQDNKDDSADATGESIAMASLEAALPANTTEATGVTICPALQELYGDLARTGQRLSACLEQEAALKGETAAPKAEEEGTKRKGRGAKSKTKQQQEQTTAALAGGSRKDVAEGNGNTAAAAWAREEAAVAAEVGGDPLGWDWGLDAGDDWWTNGGGILCGGGFDDDQLLNEIASPRRSAAPVPPSHVDDNDDDDDDGLGGGHAWMDDGNYDMPQSQRPASMGSASLPSTDGHGSEMTRGSASAQFQAAELARVFHAASTSNAAGTDVASAQPASQVQFLDAEKLAAISRIGGGPRHWKMPHQSTQAEEGKKKPVAGGKKKPSSAAAGGKSKLVLLDFSEAPPSVDDPRLCPPAGRATTQQSKASLKRAADAGPTAYLLPADHGINAEGLQQLFLRPNESAEDRRATDPSQSSTVDVAGAGAVGYGGYGDMDEGDYDAGFCDDDGDDDGDAGALPSLGPIGDPSGSSMSQWVSAAPKVNRVDVAFARKAKRVDVRRLKRDVWRHIRSNAPIAKHDDESDDEAKENGGEDENDDENQPEGAVTGKQPALSFRDMVGSLASTTPRGVTVPFYFITVLHLANENDLTLEPTDETLRDFAIQRN